MEIVPNKALSLSLSLAPSGVLQVVEDPSDWPMTTVPAGGDAMALERAETAYDVPCACGCGLRVCVRARAAQPRRSALQRLKADDPTLTALTLARTAVGDDGARWLGAALAAGARGLLRLDLSDCGLTAVGAAHVAAGVGRSASLSELRLARNAEVGDGGARALGAAVSASSTLAVLDLGRCGIAACGAAHVARGVGQSASLVSLTLRGNDGIGNAGAQPLGAALAASRTLVSLDLWDCGIAARGAALVAAGAAHSASLAELQLGGSERIGDGGARALGVALTASSSLAKLKLGWCGITAQGAAHLAEGMAGSASLVEMDLRGNQGIGDAGAHALGAAVAVSSSMTALSLCNCGLDSGAARGVVSVANGVGESLSLVQVDLEGSVISDGVARALSAAVSASRTLTKLSLGYCGITAVGAALLAAGMARSVSLAELCLQSNVGIGDAGARALGAALSACRRLANLNLGGCGLTSQGAAHVAAGVTHSVSLAELHLEGNERIGDGGARALGAAVSASSSLTKLNLGGCGITARGAAHVAWGMQRRPRAGCASQQSVLLTVVGVDMRSGAGVEHPATSTGRAERSGGPQRHATTAARVCEGHNARLDELDRREGGPGGGEALASGTPEKAWFRGENTLGQSRGGGGDCADSFEELWCADIRVCPEETVDGKVGASTGMGGDEAQSPAKRQRRMAASACVHAEYRC